MHLDIVPFRDTHLEEAAALLALRHQDQSALLAVLAAPGVQAGGLSTLAQA